MDAQNKCPRCGGVNLETGKLHGGSPLVFRPDDAKFAKVMGGDVQLSAVICLDCGNVTVEGDVEKALALTRKWSPT